jgi:hypothetical protein
MPHPREPGIRRAGQVKDIGGAVVAGEPREKLRFLDNLKASLLRATGRMCAAEFYKRFGAVACPHDRSVRIQSPCVRYASRNSLPATCRPINPAAALPDWPGARDGSTYPSGSK